MSVNSLYQDVLTFLDRLPQGGDKWDLYRRFYFDKHEAFMTAWWEQCMGKGMEVLQNRVEAVEREHYAGIRAMLEAGDIEADSREALARCRKILPAPEPVVNLMVGFFSPDGFVVEVDGEWQIGIGLERLGDIQRLPLLVAHEYAHWFRRKEGLCDSDTLGGRLVEEGLATHLSALAYPERPLCDHLFVSRNRHRVLQDYEDSLLLLARENLESREPAAIQRFLYFPVASPEAPPRPGGFVGFRLVSDILQASGLTGEKSFAKSAGDLLEILCPKRG